MSSVEHVLIVGAGHAGGRVAEHLAALGFDGRITLVGAETHLPYERPPLSKAVLAGESAPSSTLLRAEDAWNNPATTLRLGETVSNIDATARVATLRNGDTIAFSHVVIATGSGCRPLPGAPDLPTLRDIDDTIRLQRLLQGAGSLAIVGGGVIGLEVAATVSAMGIAVTVIEAGPRVMARILSPGASAWLQKTHETAGIDLLLGARLENIVHAPDGYRLRVDGQDRHADHVLVAIGGMAVFPEISGVKPGPSGGIPTDATCRIQGLDENFFAVGDVAEAWNPFYGRRLRLETWRNAETQARTVAALICGQAPPETELPWMWTDQFGRNIQVLGIWEPGLNVVHRGQQGERGASEYWLRDGRLVGAVLYDNGRDRRLLETMMRQAMRPSLAALADPSIPLRNLMKEAA